MTGASALIWKAVDIVAPSKTRFMLFNILKTYVTIWKLARIEIIFQYVPNFRQLQEYSYEILSFWEFIFHVAVLSQIINQWF